MPIPQLFEWRDELLIHVDVIDAQHKEYFARVNEVLRRAGENSREAMAAALDFVSNYAVLHFDTEQDAMRFAEYPAMDAHIEQHQHFAGRLQMIVDTFARTGFRPGLAEDLNDLLVDWFVRHIGTVDQKLGRFLRGI